MPPATRPVLEVMASPYLHLQGCTPGFEYPRKDLPEQVHWVGVLRPDVPLDWNPPSWWSEVVGSARPVVLASQGSIRPDVTELLVPTVQALAEENVLVVVTTRQADPDELTRHFGGELPANVRVTRFVPYDPGTVARPGLRHQRRVHRRDAGVGQRRAPGAGRYHRGKGSRSQPESGIPVSVSPLARHARRRVRSPTGSGGC